MGKTIITLGERIVEVDDTDINMAKAQAAASPLELTEAGKQQLIAAVAARRARGNVKSELAYLWRRINLLEKRRALSGGKK